jgi:threonine/homoserine/homoserine lactone efflux protein
MLYLLFLAWKIATAGPVQSGEEGSKPMSFLAAAMFQWVNPKAWIMAVSAIATYTVSGNYALTLAIVMLVFMLVGGPSSIAWVMFGAGLRRFLGNPRVLRIFNVSMAVLLVLSMLPVLLN